MNMVSPGADVCTATGAVLDVTLAFEHVVDAVLVFQVKAGRRRAGAASPADRAAVRDAVVQLLQELTPAVRDAAEERCALYLLRALPILPLAERPTIIALVADALADYRRGLRQVPLAGVGRLL